jgi:hypothetical protein
MGYTKKTYIVFKIHLKDIDDGALHFCIFFLDIIHRLSFLNKTQRFRDWLYLRPQAITKKRKGEMILSGGSLKQG